MMGGDYAAARMLREKLTFECTHFCVHSLLRALTFRVRALKSLQYMASEFLYLGTRMYMS